MDALRLLPRSWPRMVPGTSRQFGPPRRWTTWTEYRARLAVEWKEVLPALPCSYRPADAPPALAARLWREGWPAQGVAVLRPGRVLDAEGWPVGADDTLLIDLATGLDRPEYTAYLTRRCQLDTAKRGRALNLASCYARENYCHFLLDALPRLELFFRAGLSFADVDWVVVPAFLGSAREPFYGALGIPPEKLIRIEPGQQFEFDLLYQPSFPGCESYVPPWVIEFYRERILAPLQLPAPGGSRPRRRLYVARSQRGLSNDAEVWAELSRRGFERLEPATWEDNVRAFAEAEWVVGPHGAGLSNVVFCPAGARLVELVPGDRPFPYFYSAACAAGLSYQALLLGPLAPAGQEYRKLPSDEPRAVDIAALLALLDS
jgi:hypothetical protein